MADDTLQTGADLIGTDHVSTLNGANLTPSASTPKIQRFKNGFGDDGSYRDVSNAFPLPTFTPLQLLSTNTTVPTTVGSTVLVADTQGANHAVVRIGTATTGSFRFEVTVDGTNWVTQEAQATLTDSWAGDPITPALSNYRVPLYGYRAMRLTVVSTLGLTLQVATNLVFNDVQMSSLNIGPAPHAIGQTTPTPARATGTALAASTQLVAAPAASQSIYVTDVSVGNSGSTLTVVSLLPAGGSTVFDFPVAGSGGGASLNLTVPWRVGTGTALNYTVSAATTSWYLTVSYYTAL